MNTQFGQKDTLTEQLRQLITYHVSEASETNRAEASLTALSLQSLSLPERHVWIEVDMNGASIDLEDLATEDDLVKSIDVDSFTEVLEILHAWLSGATLEECSPDIRKSVPSVLTT